MRLRTCKLPVGKRPNFVFCEAGRANAGCRLLTRAAVLHVV
jgi:hypothetical protein